MAEDGRRRDQRRRWVDVRDGIPIIRTRLKGHKDCVSYLCTPDGPQGSSLCSVSNDNCVRIWNFEKESVRKYELRHPVKQQVREENGEEGEAERRRKDLSAFRETGLGTSFLYMSEEQTESTPRVVVGHQRGEIHEYDLDNLTLAFEFLGHTKTVTALQIHRKQLLSCSLDQTMRLWSRTEDAPQCLGIFQLGSHAVALSPALAPLPMSQVFVASWDGNVRQVDLKKQACVNVAQITEDTELTSLCTWPDAWDGQVHVFVGTADCRVHHWSFATAVEPRHQYNWKCHDMAVTAIRAIRVGDDTKNDHRLFTGSEDGSIKIWDVTPDSKDKYTILDDLRGHEGAVLDISYATYHTRRWLFSASRDHIVRTWPFEDIKVRLRERRAMALADTESRTWTWQWAALAKKSQKKIPTKGKRPGKKK